VGRVSGVFKVRIELDEADVKTLRKIAAPAGLKIRDYLEKRFNEIVRRDLDAAFDNFGN
jgi:hypothetical protein